MTKLIACDLHDYLEIACMHHYRVKLTLKDGHIVEGIAKDIITKAQREYLVLENDQIQQIELTNLSSLNVLTPDATFASVSF